MSTYYAHSGKDQSENRTDWQPLREHLLAVAKSAEERAATIEIGGRSLGPAAFAAGLLHDLGKYRPEFQQKIRDLPVPKFKTYHKQAGAAEALKRTPTSRAVAFAIAGHHGGIPSKSGLNEAIKSDSGAVVAEQIHPEAVVDCPELKELNLPNPCAREALQFDLETRLLFSCLVDADWSDTSEHDRKVNGWEKDPEPTPLTKDIAKTWLKDVLTYIASCAKENLRPEVAQARDDVLQACLTAAADPARKPGFFSLTVPTGGGKTLAGLAFSLGHAAEHDLRRIIYVAPYLSILDQNARVIRGALGVANEGTEVFEHHSLSDPSGEPKADGADDVEGLEQKEARRAAAARRAENWDAPIVITTNVQFFESLFSNEPGRCRKLHNIARSVIILDECQAIPPDLFEPTCSMLGQLVKELGCSIVLGTATQPVFDHEKLQRKGSELTDIRPIASPELNLFTRLRRVRVQWPSPGQSLTWDEIACLMTSEEEGRPPAALCVVNTRRAARELFDALSCRQSKNIFHLSTWMCPEHRSQVLNTVRARLKAKEPCYLVSTQLIEAGVDVDFPIVLRELGPLDAIIQAAGRCNREGSLNGPDGSPGGKVIVFRSRVAEEHPERYFPSDPWYVAGRDTLVNNFLNAGIDPEINDPDEISRYFNRLFNKGELDNRGVQYQRRHYRQN